MNLLVPVNYCISLRVVSRPVECTVSINLMLNLLIYKIPRLGSCNKNNKMEVMMMMNNTIKKLTNDNDYYFDKYIITHNNNNNNKVNITKMK